jgi:DNA-binding transcriptional MocR family regulator
LRQWIAEWMQRRGVSCTPDEVFITGGAQQGLAILSRLFLDRGDAAVVEAVTFTGIQQVTAGRGAEVRAIPTDLTTGADMMRWKRPCGSAGRFTPDPGLPDRWGVADRRSGVGPPPWRPPTVSR